ncbi:MAG: hypothetical protein R3C18_02830 [Planctomycetaceae bacterium]
MAQTNGPVKTFSLGRIKAKIWANSTPGNGVWFNVEIVRVFKEGDKFKESAQYGRNDLPLVSKAADMAFGWVIEQEVPARDRTVNE